MKKMIGILLLSLFVASTHSSLNIFKTSLGIIERLLSITNDQIEKNLFSGFKFRFEKNYKNDEDELKASRKLMKNIRKMEEQNEKFRKGLSKFEEDVWDHSDMEADEFSQEFNGYIGMRSARSSYEDYSSENIPRNLNYTALGFVSRVMYQGYCGGCWAFAAIGALEGQYRKKTKRLIKLSEQNLIDCNKHNDYGNWGCNGGNMDIAYHYLNELNGINPASTYRYRGNGNFACNYNPNNNITSVARHVTVESGNETTLMLALANVGPIAVAIDASLSSFQSYKSGIYDDEQCTSSPNHAVLLTGYGVDANGNEFWLIKNSWGFNWGEQGYARIARNKNNLCNIASDAVYPVLY